MKYVLKILVIVLFSLKAYGQINLVPNPSFEIFDTCPDNTTQISYAVPWFQPLTNGSTSDYYDTCSNYMNIMNCQMPRTGGGYAAILLFDSGIWREYIEVKLTTPLIVEKEYCVKFYVSLIGYASYAIDAIGAYFSKDSVLSNIMGALIYPSQINNTTGNIISDTTNWLGISGTFIADSNYNLLTIGNFKSNNNTNFIYNGGYYPAYYFIDDVSVYPCDAPVSVADAGSSVIVCKGDSILLGTHNLPEYIYKWYNEQNHLIGSTGQIYVKPPQTATYTLKVKDFKFDETTAQVTVTVKDCHDIFAPNAFTPEGDGVNDVFKVQGQNIKTLHGTIINRWGQELFKWSNLNEGWDGKYKGAYVSAGVYFYIIDVTYENGETIRKTGSVEVVRN